jgi:hypothetical protein
MAVFVQFDGQNDVQETTTTVSTGLWSGGAIKLTAGGTTSGFFTSSLQSGSSGEYYLDVHNEATASSTSEVQFSIAYGHFAGSGSKNAQSGNNPSQAIYRQFKNLILPPSQTYFQIGATGAESMSTDGYFISVARARMREKIDPGNWQIDLQTINGNHGLSLIDDSDATTNPEVGKANTFFNIVSGSIATGQASYRYSVGTTKKYYGRFYPYMGVLYFDRTLLDAVPAEAAASVSGVSLASGGSGNADDFNHSKLFKAFKADVAGTGFFQARREEEIKSTHFFCRVRNNMFNYSQNPTYYTGSNGDLTNPNFLTDPRTYLTTVGLYNDTDELLAVAKLSKPFLKTPSREATVKVRLDF